MHLHLHPLTDAVVVVVFVVLSWWEQPRGAKYKYRSELFRFYLRQCTVNSLPRHN